MDGQPSRQDDQGRVLALIHLRAALLLNCIEGIKLHAEELRRYAEQEVRLGQVWDWPDSKLFNSRERMAFALCDALIVIDEADFVAEVIRVATVRLGRDETMAIVFAVSAAVDWHEEEHLRFD